MRVAVDTNVLIAGLISPRWPYEVLQHALKGDFMLVLSPIVIREVKRHIKLRFPEVEQEFEQFLHVVLHDDVPIASEMEIGQHQILLLGATHLVEVARLMHKKRISQHKISP